MVKILAVLALVAGTARAEIVRVPDAEPDRTSVPLFGYRIGYSSLPIDGVDTTLFSLGLGIEHPLFGHFRALAEYEFVFTETHDDPARMPPPEYGTGHRLHLGLRHVLVDKQLEVLRLWVDGELGGGLGMFTDNVTGARALPDAFAGLRLGYDMHSPRPSPARTFVAELIVRMIVIDRGAGVMGGVGMYWSN
jgi:hypothetical protein